MHRRDYNPLIHIGYTTPSPRLLRRRFVPLTAPALAFAFTSTSASGRACTELPTLTRTALTAMTNPLLSPSLLPPPLIPPCPPPPLSTVHPPPPPPPPITARPGPSGSASNAAVTAVQASALGGARLHANDTWKPSRPSPPGAYNGGWWKAAKVRFVSCRRRGSCGDTS